MKHISRLLCVLCMGAWISACAPILPETPVTSIMVQFSFVTQPWLPAMQDCAGGEILAFEQRAVDFQSLEAADLVLRLGGDNAAENTFQIGSEEIVVISHPDNPLGSLTASQTQEIFSGRITNWSGVGGDDLGIQVVAFSPEEDIQRLFLDSALDGAPISTYARLVSSPGAMLSAIADDHGAVGLLTKSLLTDSVKVLNSVTEVPVLITLQEGAAGNLAKIISCLQK